MYITCVDAYNITWYYESSDMTPNSKTIMTGHVLNLYTLKSSDTGYYYCVGKDFYSERFLLSKAALYVYSKMIS